MNLVPLILVADRVVGVRVGKLADIAPTTLEIRGVHKRKRYGMVWYGYISTDDDPF